MTNDLLTTQPLLVRSDFARHSIPTYSCVKYLLTTYGRPIIITPQHNQEPGRTPPKPCPPGQGEAVVNYSAICEAPAQATLERIANQGRKLPPDAREFLERLISLQLISTTAGERFLQQASDRLSEYATAEMLGEALVKA